MDEARLRPLLRLLLAPGMHSAAAARLLARFGDDPERVLAAEAGDLARVDGVGPALAAAVAHAAATTDEADREAARCRDLGLSLLGPGDEGYPLPLLHTYDPPPLLYVRGEWREEDAVAVSVVGARRASPYGVVQAGRFAKGLAGLGVTVASGMARGVDTAAHRGALEAGGGRTVAVLGSGHARPYPAENRGLMEQAAARGAVLSEFPLDAPPLPHHFPMRNRVIAALGLGTIVVEASEKSGSLITARLAADAGRQVMAVPGRVDWPLCRGTHRLLKEGAALVEGPEDVLEALGIEIPGPTDPSAGAASFRVGGDSPGAPPPEGVAARILAALRGGDPLDADALAAAAGVPAGEARAALVDLELEGRVRVFPGGRYARA